ncbi:RNA-directed DNA polymerase [Variovorax boronicumulans]|uniref:RNA-directed DNA polymerase n=1 Tax=Variovorax boronicumulans TaxID=436515 RepID=UPI00339A6BA6
MKMKSGKLAARAINQYRKRDVITYLGLRYYLENSAARSDHWIREVAVDLVIRRSAPAYFPVQHFKEIDANGGVGLRELLLPGANEALAESALIDACGGAGGNFLPGRNVFSYQQPEELETSGIFKPYMHGLRARHSAILDACRERPEARVEFLDIRKFYPSIKIAIARQAWHSACKSTKILKKYCELGDRILSDHAIASSGSGGHLLTGPAFSHLIGNLVLRRVDELMMAGIAKYTRYVDDVTLVGSSNEINASKEILRVELEKLGLDLHPSDSPKSINISAKDWLAREGDYSEEKGAESWAGLIGDLKRFLLLYPNNRETLEQSFFQNGYRIPVPDYGAAVREKSYLTKFQELLQLKWFQSSVRNVSEQSILSRAKTLREKYQNEVWDIVRRVDGFTLLEKKSQISKLRYRLGQLTYLSPPSELVSIGHAVNSIDGMQLHSAVANAVGTGSLDNIMRFGTNAAQAAAQPMRTMHYDAKLLNPPSSSSNREALAIFQMNGVRGDVAKLDDGGNKLLQFAQKGADRDLMRSDDLFIQEIACLHGISEIPRHSKILSTAFDPAEDIALDAIEQINQYPST